MLTIILFYDYEAVGNNIECVVCVHCHIRDYSLSQSIGSKILSGGPSIWKASVMCNGLRK